MAVNSTEKIFMICSKCNKDLPEDEFYFRSQKSRKRYRQCKKCMNAASREYTKNNKEKIAKNKAKYYRNNKDYFTKYWREYMRKRRKNDLEFRLKSNINRSIHKFLKARGNSKKGSLRDHLPFTIEDLKSHLESLFEPWMSWDNWGVYNHKTWNDADKSTWTWNLDHIIPHSKFKYSSISDISFRKCWDLSNLRPLSSKQNFLDGVRRERH